MLLVPVRASAGPPWQHVQTRPGKQQQQQLQNIERVCEQRPSSVHQPLLGWCTQKHHTPVHSSCTCALQHSNWAAHVQSNTSQLCRPLLSCWHDPLHCSLAVKEWFLHHPPGSAAAAQALPSGPAQAPQAAQCCHAACTARGTPAEHSTHSHAATSEPGPAPWLHRVEGV